MSLRSSSLSLLLAGTLLPLAGQEEVLPLTPSAEQKEEEAKKNKDARFRIPLGAVISNITLPYFDKENRQISLLTAEVMTVEGGDSDLDPDAYTTEVQQLNGKRLKLWLFDKEGLIRSISTIPEARYQVKDEQLVTSGDLIMRGADNKFAARASGAIFTLKTGQALFMGPGVTRFSITKKDQVSMIHRPLLPLTAAMQMLIAAPPEMDPDHLERFERLVAPTPAPDHDIEKQFATAEQNNAELAKRVADYLILVGKTEILTQVAKPHVPAPDPLDELFAIGPDDISIDFDKGAYLDSEALEAAYFGNITVQGLGLKMTCDKDLKIIFNPPAPKLKKEGEKDDPKEKKDKKKTSPIGNFAGFGDPKQITATGKIRVEGTNKDGKKFFLGGDRALFETDPKNPKREGTITLRGDKLGVITGDPYDKESKEPISQAYSKTKDAYVIVHVKQGLDPTQTDLTIEFSKGNWQFGLRDPEKK